MNKWVVRFGAMLMVVVIAAGAVSAASAQGPDGPRGPRQGGRGGWSQAAQGPIRDRLHARFENSLIGVLAEMAGVEVSELAREAVTPPSLAEIAESYGLDVDAVIAETEQRITDEVNAAVADGQMTQAEADDVLDGLHDRLVERFNAPFRPFMWAGRMMRERGGFGGMMGFRRGQTY